LELILAKDPFYKAGIAEYDIIEFDPGGAFPFRGNAKTASGCRQRDY
jgi:hypothetical protein